MIYVVGLVFIVLFAFSILDTLEQLLRPPAQHPEHLSAEIGQPGQMAAGHVDQQRIGDIEI
jgi:hypothetical protein